MIPTPIVPQDWASGKIDEVLKPTGIAVGDKVLWRGIGPLEVIADHGNGMLEALSLTFRVQSNEIDFFQKV